MVKYHVSSAIFKYTWEQVAISFWQRYPNPYSKHVLSEDVLSREIINGKLHTKRLFTKTNPMPRWGTSLVKGPLQVCVVEESIVDPDAKTITTYTRNIGLNKVMTIEERCDYKVSPVNIKSTQCDRWAWIYSSFYGFGRAIQAFAVERFRKNAIKNIHGFNLTLEKLFMPEPMPAQQIGTKEILKERAKAAAEMAKSKACPLLPAPGQA